MTALKMLASVCAMGAAVICIIALTSQPRASSPSLRLTSLRGPTMRYGCGNRLGRISRHIPHQSSMNDIEKLMQNGELGKQYEEALKNPDIKKMVDEQMKIMQNPDFVKKVEALRSDPEMAEIFKEMETGGVNAMMKYYNDPAFLSKLTEKMGDMTSIMGSVGSPGGMMQTPPELQNQMNQMMKDPDTMAKFQKLSNDPELQPFLAKIREGGPDAMQAAMSDPAMLQKFQQKMEQLGIDPATMVPGGAMGAAPPVAAAPAVPAGPEIETLLDAARYGDEEAAEDLAFVGKDVNMRDSEQRTPIHWACAGGHINVAKILIENGADLSALDSKGNTPLHYATGYGQPAAAKLLLENGAPTDTKNKNGKTAKDVVTLNPNNPIASEADIMAKL